MKIVFIIKKLSISDPMGIMCLSSILKKAGHETDLICFAKENLFEKLKELKLVAYSLTLIIRLLIKFPENKIYNLVYSASYGGSLWNVYSTAFGSNLKLIKSAKRLLEYTL